MKKLSFLALAAVGLLLSACTDKNEEVNTAQLTEEFTDGAYLGISLQLPSADLPATRANDDLSNGTEAEFAVKNATLYIFKDSKNAANPDATATYVGYVTLGTSYAADKKGGINPDEWGIQEGVDETNVTSTYSDAALIPNTLASEMKNDTENDYYAYVIVNHNGQVPALNDGSEQGSTATTFADFSKEEFSEIGADIAAKAKIKESGLLMTNSPICKVQGGIKTLSGDDVTALGTASNYSTLVKLDNTKIFGSADLAKESPAGCVYIERAAVKITVEAGDNLNSKIGDLDVAIQGWQVINYEPTYYNTRQIESTWGPYFNGAVTRTDNYYRFVSKYQFLPTLPEPNPATGDPVHTVGYRTFFAKDVHYDKDATAGVTAPATSHLRKTVAIDEEAQWITVGSTNHAYTTENTFDVGRQTWQNTTMVTLKVKIGDGSGFFTVGKGSQIVLADAAAAKAAIANKVKDDPVVTTKYNALLDKISENNTDDEVTPGLKVEFTTPSAGKTGVQFTVTPDYKVGSAAATYEGTGEAALKAELEEAIADVINVTTGTGASAVTTSTADAVLLSYYKGGISFYNARIKHFDDVETPWSATGSYISGGGKNVKEIYAYDITKGVDDAGNIAASNNFLGRYGVVRDNWYKLSIDAIGKIGTAEPVDPSKTTPDTPDDEIENFISVHVHILPWVLRSQSVIF